MNHKSKKNYSENYGNISRFKMLLLFLSMLAYSANAQITIAYWNFNDNIPTSNQNWVQSISANQGNGTLTYSFTEAYSFTGTVINSLENEAGGSFVPRGGAGQINNGRHLTLFLPQVAYNSVTLSYAVRRTATGFTTHEISYTVNGSNWLPIQSIDLTPFGTSWNEVSVSLHDVAEIMNNPLFALRITVLGSTGAEGNNRIDNLKITPAAELPDSEASLETLTIGGINVLNLPNIEVNNPETGFGALLEVEDFSDFFGIVAVPLSSAASRRVKHNGTLVNDSELPYITISNGDVVTITVEAEDETTIKHYKVTVQLPTTPPELDISETNFNFGDVFVNTTSNVRFYYVSGSNLGSGLTIETSGDYRISFDCHQNYSQTLALPANEGFLESTRVYVRFAPIATGTGNGEITHRSGLTVLDNIALNGNGINHQIPPGYYSSATGSGAELITNLHKTVRNHYRMDYSDLWTSFATTDLKYNGKIWDIYSDRQCEEPPYEFEYYFDQEGVKIAGGFEGSVYNREHSWPRSWWGGGTTSLDTMNTDIHHIYPTDKEVNAMRSNYPFGLVASPNRTSLNGSRLGNNSFGHTYQNMAFEPIDEYKGDLARTYFYMVTRYNPKMQEWALIPEASYVLNGTAWPAFEPWALEMLLLWHFNDPVSQKEMDRNNAIYAIQGNRNPFIDHPELVELIWGAPDFTLTIQAEGNGTVNINGIPYNEPLYFPAGSYAELEALPASGWHFDGWRGAINSQLSTENILMNQDKTILARFTPATALPVDKNIAHVYPNPFRETLYVHGASEILRIYIVNLSGQTVMTISNPKSSINTGHLSNGLYFIMLEFNNHSFTKVKAIKQ